MKHEEFLKQVKERAQLFGNLPTGYEVMKLLAIIEKLKAQRYRMLAEKYAGFPNKAMNEETILNKELDEIVGMG